MDIKKDILWRVYLCFIALVLFGFAVLGRVVQLQFVQGTMWRNMGDSMYKSIEKRPAERGTIFSDEMEMLSSSIPFFDIHIDFRTEALHAKNGKIFYDNIDSLSYQLNKLFNDKSKAEYKQMLKTAYLKSNPYFELKTKLTYQQYFKLRNFAMVKLGKNKSGFLVDVKDVRLNPFGLMANRTIGLSRDPQLNVGLEKYYDSTLSGANGSRLVQSIAGGARVPINGTDIEPINGNDVVTTLNVQIQDITQNALLKMMVINEALTGTAIVMEVSTGKIKAIANLGFQKKGVYYEDNNYALIPSEPGSTIKIVNLLAAIEDKIVTINNTVEINGGKWNYGDRKIVDAEQSPKNVLTYKEAIEHSSNVAMAKLVVLNYAKQPKEYLKYYTKLRLVNKSGIDLNDPYFPRIKNTNSDGWSNQTLASMGFGYEMRISPLQTLMVYNAIANNGKMMKPYLVTDIKQEGELIQHIEPTVLVNSICNNATLLQLQQCLEAVCIGGTAKSVFDSISYTVAGKTGTTEVDDGTFKYRDNVHQSSFVGYFPADKPRYSCIVVIKNKPNAITYFGGKVAAPVFKEIADQLIVLAQGNYHTKNIVLSKDSSTYNYKAATADINIVANQMAIQQNNIKEYWAIASTNKQQTWQLNSEIYSSKQMPNVVGMGLRDAINCLENKGLIVKANGTGKVNSQSIVAGTTLTKGTSVLLNLK